MQRGLFGTLNELSQQRWMWLTTRTLIRAATLGTALWCVLVAGRMLLGWQIEIWMLVAGAALPLVGGAALVLLRRPLTPTQAARRLDRRFRLREQLSTAIERARAQQPGPFDQPLLEGAAATANALRRKIDRQLRFPWDELGLMTMMVLLAVGLTIMSGIAGPELSGAADPLPQLAAPEGGLPPLEDQLGGEQQPVPNPAGGQQPQPGQRSQPPEPSGDPRVLEPLADALREQGLTRPAAEALDEGDQQQAADRLREVADQAAQLSDQERGQLANALRRAADEIQQHDPSFADQLRRSAAALDRGGQEAAQGLDDLAEALEQLGSSGSQPQAWPGEESQGQPGQSEGQAAEGEGDQDGGGGGDGAGEGGTAGEQESRSERLDVDGVPLELKPEGEGNVPAQQNGQQPTDSGPASDRPLRPSDGRTSGNDVGADPLVIPLDERNVVQDYFTP